MTTLTDAAPAVILNATFDRRALMRRTSIIVIATVAIVAFAFTHARTPRGHPTSVHRAAAHDVSPPLASLASLGLADPLRPDVISDDATQAAPAAAPIAAPAMTTPPGSGAVEQTAQGTKPPADLVASFDGLGAGFAGPQGSAALRNPSDNTLAVGPNHIVQIVNSRMSIFTKKGRQFDTTRKALYGAVPTNNIFRGFGGPCEQRNNGDAVVRYDQLADRWLVVMPIFSRGPVRADEPTPGRGGDPARRRAWRPDTGCGPAGIVRDVLRAERRLGSVRSVLPVRVRPSALSRLPASKRLARRLLRADQHGRQRDREARLRGGSLQDARGQGRDRAVHRHRRRELPQQCRPRWKGAASQRRSEHHARHRWHAAQEDHGGRRALRVDVSCRLERSTADEGRRSGEDHGGTISLSLRRAADELRAAARDRSAPRCAGRQDYGEDGLSSHGKPRVDRRRSLGEHDGGRRRGSLV